MAYFGAGSTAQGHCRGLLPGSNVLAYARAAHGSPMLERSLWLAVRAGTMG